MLIERTSQAICLRLLSVQFGLEKISLAQKQCGRTDRSSFKRINALVRATQPNLVLVTMKSGHYLPAARKRQILDKTTNIISMLSHESMLFRCEKMNTLPP
jgi:hypothetical protein